MPDVNKQNAKKQKFRIKASKKLVGGVFSFYHIVVTDMLYFKNWNEMKMKNWIMRLIHAIYNTLLQLWIWLQTI